MAVIHDWDARVVKSLEDSRQLVIRDATECRSHDRLKVLAHSETAYATN